MSDTLFEQAVGFQQGGEALRARGDLRGAAEQFTRMRDVLSERAAAMPTDPLAMLHVTTALQSLATVRAAMGEPNAALVIAADAMSICESLHQIDPDDPEAARDVHLCCDLLGDILRDTGRLQESVPHHERAVRLARRLASRPGGDELQKANDLAGSLERLAWTLEDLGRLEEALTLQREQVAIARDLVVRSDGDPRWHKFLASSLTSIGEVLTRLGCSVEAQSCFQEALDQCALAFRDVVQGPSELLLHGVTHRGMGQFQTTRGDLTAAKEHLAVAVQLLREALTASPDDVSCRAALRKALRRLADVHRALGDDASAATADSEADELEAQRRGE